MSDRPKRKDGEQPDWDRMARDAQAINTLHQAIREAFELSLRWMAIVTDHVGEKLQVIRYGPFDSHDEAEVYAHNIANDSNTRIEIVEMHDVAVHNARVNRWHEERDELRRYTRAMQTLQRDSEALK